jgi:hypothetical protein
MCTYGVPEVYLWYAERSYLCNILILIDLFYYIIYTRL